MNDKEQDLNMLKMITRLMITFQRLEIVKTHPEDADTLTDNVDIVKDETSLQAMINEYWKEYFSHHKYLKHLRGIEKIRKVMKLTFKTLKFSKNKSNILKSICSLVVWFITNISINRIEQHSNLTLCFKKVADFLDITEDQLELIMDILSGNPYRIFKATGSVSDSDKKQSTGSTPLTRRSSVKTTQYVSSGYLFLKSRILTL